MFVLARLAEKGLEPAPAGEEHRYYAGAGKYTALFWSVTAYDTETRSQVERILR